MVILESKEELFKRLNEAWHIITRADEALANAASGIAAAQAQLRTFSRGMNDQGSSHRTTEVHPTSRVAATSSQKAQELRGVPPPPGQYVLRA